MRPLLSFLAAGFFLSVPLGAQPLFLDAERQVSNIRTGLAGLNWGDRPNIASSGESFLAVWQDDRESVDTRPYWSSTSTGHAMRFASDGTPLDSESILLPRPPRNAVWAERTGSCYLVDGTAWRRATPSFGSAGTAY